MTRFLTLLTFAVAVSSAAGWVAPPLWRQRRARRRAPSVAWFDLRPKAGREITPESIAALAATAKKGIEKRNGHAGLIGHRFIHQGQLRSVIGIWGADVPHAVAGQLASAVNGVAEALPTAPILPSGERAIAFLKRHDPLDTTAVLDPGACSQWLAETMAQTENPCLSFSVETIEPWESDRKRQWLAVSQMSREGSSSSVGTLGPATARQSGARMMRVRAIATGPTFDEASVLVTGFGEQLVGFSQTLGGRVVDDIGRVLPFTFGLAGLAPLWFLAGHPVVALVLLLGSAAAFSAARSRLVNFTGRETEASLDRGLVVAPIPRPFYPRWSIQGFFRSSFRDMNPTDAVSKTTGARTANPHTRDLFTMDALQLAGLVGFPTGAHAAVEASSSVERPAPRAVMHGTGLRAGVDPGGMAVWWADADHHSNLVAFGEPGSGKALALDTPVPTPDGWRTMGELAPGDKVFDLRGRACAVTFATPVMEGRPCFEVVLANGEVITADAEHLWLTGPEGSPASVRSTAEIAASLLDEGGAPAHFIPAAGALTYPPGPPLPLDAYLLGVALRSLRPGGVLAAPGTEPYFWARGYATAAIAPGRFRVLGDFSALLDRLGVDEGEDGPRRIPPAYLRAPAPERLSLLAGFFDAHRALGPTHGPLRFTTVFAAEADDLAELAAGLGGVATVARRSVPSSRSLLPASLPVGVGGPAPGSEGLGPSRDRLQWLTRVVGFTAGSEGLAVPGEAQETVHLVEIRGLRPTARPSGVAAGDLTGPASHAIVAVRPVPSVPVRCIQVDSPDRLYLAGASCIPTHNTTLLMNLWWSALIQRRRRAAPGTPARTMFWIETKGDGAARAQLNARRALAADVGVVAAAAPTGPRLDLVLWADPRRGAELLVESMRYAFGEDDIGERAAGVLRGVFRIAIACPPDIAVRLGWPGGQPNVMRLAYWLLGGDPQDGRHTEARNLLFEAASGIKGAGDETADEGLAGAMGDPEQALAPTEVGQAWRDFSRYLPPHMAKKDSDLLFESSRNKLEALLVAQYMWEPDPARPAFSPADALAGGWAAILNFGPPGAGQPGYTTLLSQRLGAMTLFGLWDAVRVTCSGWQQMGRSVMIFSDEIRDLCGTGADNARDVIAEMADQGRSFGVRMFLASQRPDQIPAGPRRAIMGFGARIYFRLDELANAEAASLDLDEAFSLREIRALADGTSACRMKVQGVTQAAFTIKPLPDALLDEATHDSPQPPTPDRPAGVEAIEAAPAAAW